MSEAPSDPLQRYPDVPLQDPEPQTTGRTFWDLVSGKGRLILVALIVAVAAVMLFLNRNEIDWAEVRDFFVQSITDYWYVAVGPVAGYALGIWFARLVHRPICRVVISLDVENHVVQALVIPEDFFRFLNQTGNNVVYHSPQGTPVYIANKVDLDRCLIDYGWVHEHDSLVVFTKEMFYTEWKETLDQAMADNLKLMDSPEVYGMQFAGEALKRHLDRVGAAVGVMKGSSGGPSDYHEAVQIQQPEGGAEDAS